MAYSNHRYDTADYMRIDPMLGDENDLFELCARAREQGILIILDGVFSHVGSNSKYFDSEGIFGGGAVSDPSSPYRDWFDFTSYPDEYDCWWDVPTLPCVKEMSEGFLDLIIRNDDSVVAHWMRLGVSGFRLDVADELPDEFIELLRKRVKELDPEGIVIGEVWEDASNKISYGKRRRYFSGGELDGVMNYVFRDGIINLLCSRITATEFADTVNEIVENYPASALNCTMTLLSSHDTTRIQTELGRVLPDTVKGLKAASTLQYFLPGMPMVYYGDEVGMKGGDDPANRGFFRPEAEAEELVSHYTELGQMRRDPRLALGRTYAEGGGDTVRIIREYRGSSMTLTLNVKTLEYTVN
jgi:glycosidase